MNRLIAIFLIALCTVPSLQGQVDTSYRIKFYRTWLFQDWTNKSVFGVLYKVRDSSLLLANTADKRLLATGKFVISEVYSDQIHRVVMQQSGKRGLGTMIGLLAGFTTGLTVALVQNSKWKMSSENQDIEDFNNGMRAFGIIAITVGFTGAGVGIGAMIDAIAKIKIKVAGDQARFEASRARLEGYSLDYLYHGALNPGRSLKKSADTVAGRDGIDHP